MSVSCPGQLARPGIHSPSGLATHQEGSSHFVLGRRASSLKALRFLWPEVYGLWVLFVFFLKDGDLISGWHPCSDPRGWDDGLRSPPFVPPLYLLPVQRPPSFPQAVGVWVLPRVLTRKDVLLASSRKAPLSPEPRRGRQGVSAGVDALGRGVLRDVCLLPRPRDRVLAGGVGACGFHQGDSLLAPSVSGLAAKD